MTAFNCLTFALDRWNTDGGYLVARRSAHWGIPHLIAINHEGLQHYAPGAPLGHPVQALTGFRGEVWDRDLHDAPPMPIRGIVAGSWLFALGVTLWACSKVIRRLWQ